MLALITGGSGSGKSAYAENLCVAMHKAAGKPLSLPMLYIATMFPFDEEAYRKIDRHKELRKTKHFDAVEQYTGLHKLSVEPATTILLECMSNLVANEMYQEGGAGDDCVAVVTEGVKHLKAQGSDLVIVSNEIFSDGIEYHPETWKYQRYLGKINQGIAAQADIVVEVVYGIPVIHKGADLLGEIYG